MKGTLWAGLLALWPAATGCWADAPDPSPPPAEAPAAASPPADTKRGESPLRYEGGLVWLEAQGADPRRVLWELSEAVGFLLELSDLDPDPVSLHFEGAGVPEVVAALARELPFGLDYERDPVTGRHAVASVRVGVTPEVPPSVPRAPVVSPPPQTPRRERFTAEHARLIRALGIANVEARRELVEGLDAVGIELEVLSHVMQTDPEPEIRALAADTLATSGTYGAVKHLVESLGSEDPTVLLVAIEALEFAGDETVLPDLARLFDHPSPAVREAAREAVEFLR